MEHDRFKRAEQIYHDCMALAPEGREEFIARAAMDDADLAAWVRRLVSFDEQSQATFNLRPTGVTTAEEPIGSASLEGQVVGPYRIGRLVGEGGFGAVYQAQQEHPVRRTVAIKVLKTSVASSRVIARFEVERQALAMMEHPGIARIFDAGQTDAAHGSRPYFVMEFVTGEPITDYCNRLRLDLTARLELFIFVCKAVQHAHHRGIIHRDLKPSNILVSDVDGVAMPKVIDFGIAKAIDEPVIGSALVTSQVELLGTPQYMSPEQADADKRAIDTRTDVYSLGVILYELLTGTTPLTEQSLNQSGYSHMLQLISDQRFERPSLRLAHMADDASAAAQNMNTDVHALRRRLRGELDWIVVKALDAERDRRYDSAAAFADDIGRYMHHQPVAAGPPSAMYRVRKFVRRHRVGVTATVLVIAAIVSGAVVSVISMVRAKHSAQQTAQINAFMAEVLGSPSPDKGGHDVRLVTVLSTASTEASERFAGHPELEAQVRDIIGQVFSKLDLGREAAVEFQQSIVLWESVGGEHDRRAINSRLMLIGALLAQNLGRSAERELEIVRPRLTASITSDDVMALEFQRLSGITHRLRGRIDQAVEELEQLRQHSAAQGVSNDRYILILESLLSALVAQTKQGSSERQVSVQESIIHTARELLKRSEQSAGPPSISTLWAQSVLAQTLFETNRPQEIRESADLARSVVEQTQSRLGECHVVRLHALRVLAWSTNRLGDPQTAADSLLESIACRRNRAAGADIIGLISELHDALPYIEHGGRAVEGEKVAREYLALTEDLGTWHGNLGFYAECFLARFLSQQGRFDESEPLYQSLLARAEIETVDAPTTRATLHMFYGEELAQRGRYEEAEYELSRALDQFKSIGSYGTLADPNGAFDALHQLYRTWGKPDKLAEIEQSRTAILPR